MYQLGSWILCAAIKQLSISAGPQWDCVFLLYLNQLSPAAAICRIYLSANYFSFNHLNIYFLQVFRCQNLEKCSLQVLSACQVAGMKKKRNFDKADTNLEHRFETFLK